MDETEVAVMNNGSDSVTSTDWRLWCRLCAKEDPQNIDVLFKDEQTVITGNQMNDINANRDTATSLNSSAEWEQSLVAFIQKHFNVQITREEELPKMLCTECFSMVTSLANFVERVEKVQLMYNALQNSKENPVLCQQEFRLRYGFLDEDRQQIFTQQLMPEVHYLEMKPKVNEILGEKVFEANVETISTNPLDYEHPRITIKIKKERLAENPADEEDYEYDNDDDYLVDPFDGNNIEASQQSSVNELSNDIDEGDLDDDTNLASLRNALNAKSQSSYEVDQSPHKHQRRGRKRKNNDSSITNANNIEMPENTPSIVELNRLRTNELREIYIYDCSECPQRFKRVQNFRLHMQRKHNSAPSLPQHSCTQCECIFNTQNQLERHSKKHLPLELKRVMPCPYCDKKFTTKSFVATHIKFVHMNERLFICEECGDAVRTSAALREHMLIHTDFAPFECDICHKGLKNQARLKRHKEIHDQNKHICAECGLQLNSRTTLNRHLLVHSDKMQHKCDYCGRAFKRVKALKNHLILHTGLKPYSCDFCDRTFANGSNCRTHKKKAHPKELAELEASGGKSYTRNIPRIEALKAVTKAADNLTPVVSKQSGNFAFGKKPKLSPSDAGTVRTKPTKAYKQLVNSNDTNVNNLHTLPAVPLNAQLTTTEVAVATTDINGVVNDECNVGANNVVPIIDNIYSHLIKQANLANNNHVEALPNVDTVDENAWHYRATHEANTQ